MARVYTFDDYGIDESKIDTTDPVAVKYFIQGIKRGINLYEEHFESEVVAYKGLMVISNTTEKIIHYEPIDPLWFVNVSKLSKESLKILKPLVIKLFLEDPRREMTAYIASLNRKEKVPYFPTNQGTRHSYSSSVFESIFDNLVYTRIRRTFVEMLEYIHPFCQDRHMRMSFGICYLNFLKNFRKFVSILPSFKGWDNGDYIQWQREYSIGELKTRPIDFSDTKMLDIPRKGRVYIEDEDGSNGVVYQDGVLVNEPFNLPEQEEQDQQEDQESEDEGPAISRPRHQHSDDESGGESSDDEESNDEED